MIANLELPEFAGILHSVLSPTAPIESQEHIFGGDPAVREIEDALETAGIAVFIYGDHEVGKASLAQAIEAHQAAGAHLLKPGGSKKYTPVLIDEFDAITNNGERIRFADFIRQIDEGSTPVLFVFCNVSDSLKKLLGAHESSYLENINRPPPSSDVSFEIIDRAEEAIKTLPPHCVYLLSENLFWEMFNDPTFARSLR